MKTVNVDVEMNEARRVIIVAIIAEAMNVPLPGMIKLVTRGVEELYEVTAYAVKGVKRVGCPQTAHKVMKNYDAV